MKALEDAELERAIQWLEKLNDRMVVILGSTDTTHQGGYFCLTDDYLQELPFRSLVRVGRVIDERKFEGYRRNAQEKVRRLLLEHRDHATSWQSREPELQRYGGGIRVSFNDISLVMAFSGFPEYCDEALMFALAIKMGWLTAAQAHVLAANDDVRGVLSRLLAA